MTRYGGASSPTLEKNGGGGKAPVTAGPSIQEVAQKRTELYTTFVRGTGHIERSSDPYELLYKERRASFQQLVRWYIIQIRYGCTEKNCTTPTCFSCHKRVKAFPVRRPNILTARTLAFHLASQEDPYAGLCSHRPLALEEDFVGVGSANIEHEHVCWQFLDSEAQNDAGTHVGKSQPERGSNEALPAPIKEMKEEIVPVESAEPPSGHPKPIQDEPVSPVIDYKEKHRPPGYNKDRRSLPQNLFDTRAIKTFEWKMLPSPIDILRQPLRQVTEEKTHSFMNGSAIKPHENGISKPKPLEQPKAPAAFNQTDAKTVDSRSPKKIPNGYHEPVSDLETEDQIHATFLPNGKSPLYSPNIEHHETPLSPQLSASQRSDEIPVLTHLCQGTMMGLRALAWHATRQDASFSFDIDFHYSVSQLFLQGFHHIQTPPGFTDLHSRKAIMDYVKRSLSYNLSSSDRLKACIQYHKAPNKDAPKLHDVHRAVPDYGIIHICFGIECFSFWTPMVGPLILDSLWHSLEALFVPPPSISSKINHERSTKSGSAKEHKYVQDADAADIIMITILALVGSVEKSPPGTLINVRNRRAWGRTLANSKQSGPPDPLSDPWLLVSDSLEYEPALRLAQRLVRAIATRRSFWLISKAMHGEGESHTNAFPLMQMVVVQLVEQIRSSKWFKKRPEAEQYSLKSVYRETACFLEFLRTVMVKSWDGKAEVKRWEGIGAAMELLGDLYPHRRALMLQEDAFYMPFISEHLSDYKFVTDFAHFTPSQNSLHVLQFPFLFLPSVRVIYFRVLNFTSMSDAYQTASYHRTLKDRLSFAISPANLAANHPQRRDRGWNRNAFLDTNMKAALDRYLVLDVRRDYLLEDTMNQLWGREKRELLRPLKVRMGMGEGGEEGVDHGGVSQEFFRLVFEKVFDPDAGLFTTDPQTRMSWFQPMSLEPLSTFELIGLLVGLAVYNGVTLPTTFPLALYQKLLHTPPEQIVIYDGWPELHRGLLELLQWKDGDVADVFVREYAFGFEANGRRYTVDMLNSRKSKGKQSAEHELHHSINGTRADLNSELPFTPYDDQDGPNRELELVTNANRFRFVADYIAHLTHLTISPQYTALSRGFYTLIPSSHLKLLSPEILRTVAEGYQNFDIRGLVRYAKYEDGYTRDSEVVKWFWDVVMELDDKGKRALLEFVTSSSRVPVQGWRGVGFSVVRGGGDTDRIPTSMTCFGKLLLPEYSSRDKLKAKLKIALENSRGFGAA